VAVLYLGVNPVAQRGCYQAVALIDPSGFTIFRKVGRGEAPP
jgi:hypothetical protein